MAPQMKALAAAPPPPPVIHPADRISKLPKDIQEHILSFLPAQEAVRTCALARTWRDVWKSTRRLLIKGESVKEVREFVDGLLRVRGGASLDAIEFIFDPWENIDGQAEETDDFVFDDDELSSLNRWIRCVMECQIQTLRLDVSTYNDYFKMDREPLISCHLTRLELRGVTLSSLNLDGCPLLEHLEIDKCLLRDVRKLMSLSLKRLVITSCVTARRANYKRIRICVPRLVSLLLDDMDFRIPLLGRMPELMGAMVKIDYSRHDSCHCDDPVTCYHVMQAIDTSDSDFGEAGSEGSAGQNTTECVVLEGLAQAKDLVLIAHPSMYIFRRDLRWCPTFSKLKTLVLNEFWSQSTDCSALACMLQHAPVLEKLTILFSRVIECKYDVVVEGRPDATRKSTMISQHLKIVEVKCFEVHQRVLKF